MKNDILFLILLIFYIICKKYKMTFLFLFFCYLFYHLMCNSAATKTKATPSSVTQVIIPRRVWKPSTDLAESQLAWKHKGVMEKCFVSMGNLTRVARLVARWYTHWATAALYRLNFIFTLCNSAVTKTKANTNPSIWMRNQ